MRAWPIGWASDRQSGQRSSILRTRSIPIAVSSVTVRSHKPEHNRVRLPAPLPVISLGVRLVASRWSLKPATDVRFVHSQPQRGRSAARISGSDPEDSGSNPLPAAKSSHASVVQLDRTLGYEPRDLKVRVLPPVPSPGPSSKGQGTALRRLESAFESPGADQSLSGASCLPARWLPTAAGPTDDRLQVGNLPHNDGPAPGCAGFFTRGRPAGKVPGCLPGRGGFDSPASHFQPDGVSYFGSVA